MPPKLRPKIPKENKVRAELQQQIGSMCPFCESTDVGHFEIHHIDENPANNGIENLLLVCPTCHSKITKSDIGQVDVLRKKISLLQSPVHSKQLEKKIVNFNGRVGNAIIGDNNSVSIRQIKKQKYPEGCLGYDTMKANYVSHLINRFNEYKEYELGKGNVKYAVFSSQLKRHFKLGPTRTINNLPISRFDELVNYIQSRINSTKLARIKGRSHKNYSSFEEYSSGASLA